MCVWGGGGETDRQIDRQRETELIEIGDEMFENKEEEVEEEKGLIKRRT